MSHKFVALTTKQLKTAIYEYLEKRGMKPIRSGIEFGSTGGSFRF